MTKFFQGLVTSYRLHVDGSLGGRGGGGFYIPTHGIAECALFAGAILQSLDWMALWIEGDFLKIIFILMVLMTL